MTLRTVSAFVASWRGVATGVTSLFVLIGFDGRATAQRLDRHLNSEVPLLLRVQSVRDSAQDEILQEVRALALSACLKETNAIARQRLRCGEREREAGVVRPIR
jgi:hypothetical protein